MTGLNLEDRRLMKQALALLRRATPEVASRLATEVEHLNRATRLCKRFPPHSALQIAGGSTAAQALGAPQGSLSALHLPPGGLLAEMTLVVKTQLLRSTREGLSALGEQALHLVEQTDTLICKCLHTRMLTEGLLAILRAAGRPEALRLAAGEQLVQLWNGRAVSPLKDAFSEALFGLEQLANTAPVGVELRGLARFVPLRALFRSRDPERDEAFSELLSGDAHAALLLSGCAEIEEDFETQGLALRHLGRQHDSRPERAFRSYRLRQRLCELRAWRDLPGPRRTAEDFVVQHLLKPGRRSALKQAQRSAG